MSSERKVAANRQNASRSTGPRTQAGKDRVRRNALRHGLATNILADPVGSAEIERLARLIIGEQAGPEQRQAARVVAETQLEIGRVRAVRAALVNISAGRPEIRPVLPAGQLEAGDGLLTSTAVEIDSEMAEAVLRIASQLGRLDRYERRALARRKRGFAAIESCAVAKGPLEQTKLGT